MKFILKALRTILLIGSPFACLISVVWSMEHSDFEEVVRTFISEVYFVFFAYIWFDALVDAITDRFDKED